MATKPMPRICSGMSGNHVMNVSSTQHLLPLSSGLSKNLISSPELSDVEKHTKRQVNISPQIPDISKTDNMDVATSAIYGDTACPKHLESVSQQTSGTSSVSTLVSTQIRCSDLPVSMQETLTKNTNDVGNEVQKCKELMMLQVSLISRQQDLLKLRDKEIMKLKAENQSLKCRLERMERRISLSRKHTKPSYTLLSKHNKCDTDDKPKPGKKLRTQHSEMDSSTENEMDHVADFEIKNQSPTLHSQHEELNSQTSRKVQDNNKVACSTSKATVSMPKKQSAIPLSESTCFPVPVSFIERCQNQLLSSILSSPIVTVKDTEVFSATSAGTDSDSSRVAFKICNRCPHCIAMATEITRLLSISNNADKVIPQSKELLKRPLSPMHQPMLKVSNITPKLNDSQEEPPELRTCHRYYRQFCISSLNSYQAGDEGVCDDVLNIPTWRVSDLESLHVLSPTVEMEFTDDDIYCRRHSKFEVAEKRRKRWDIQRIREYRYNEKLRQKLFKPERFIDAMETFMPTVFDINAVEVEETLPINVFGHSLPLMKPMEFSLHHPEQP